MATLGIPQNTIEVLQKYNFNFQKKFGQNFLIDTHVLEKIISVASGEYAKGETIRYQDQIEPYFLGPVF